MKTKETFLKWYTNWVNIRRKKGIKIDERDYQPEKIWEIITTSNKRFVLSAAPNSGKTLMSIIYIDWCVYNNPNFKAIVLTHGIDDLREQYIGEVEYFCPDFINNKNIIINLPKSLFKKDLKKVDLIIVDEAHHYYFAEDGMVQTIIKKTKPEQELLLTGTPSDFIMYNKTNDESKHYHLSFVSVCDLWKRDLCQNVLIEVASSTGLNYGIKDYTKDGEVKQAFSKNNVHEMMDMIMKRLRSYVKMDPVSHKRMRMITSKALFLKTSIEKTMIVCRNTKEAEMVKEFLVGYGYEESAMVKCTSDNKASKNLRPFKEDPNIKFAIVVYRGILGFNCSELSNIVDLTGSKNINRNLQLYCRLIRKGGKNKFYYKVVPDELIYYFEKMMEGVLHLSHTHFLKMFDGKNFLDLPIIPLSDMKKRDRSKSTERKVKQQPVLALPIIGLENVFNLIQLWHKGNKPLDSKAYTTMKNVMIELGHASKKWTNATKDECDKALMEIFGNNGSYGK